MMGPRRWKWPMIGKAMGLGGSFEWKAENNMVETRSPTRRVRTSKSSIAMASDVKLLSIIDSYTLMLSNNLYELERTCRQP